MDDQGKPEPARSRWAPKPEQILILESIFNSGTVNPTKDETSRIRALLGRYGPVADANVFYWFQNRRSRSRRNRLRAQDHHHQGATIQNINYNNNSNNNNNNNNNNFQYEDNFLPNASAAAAVGPTSSSPIHSNILLNYDHHHHQDLLDGNYNYVNSESYAACSSPRLSYQPDVITVYINGVATELRREAVNMKAMFGGDFVMYHSSGVPVEVNEYGYVVQGLQHGESYFIVPRNS